MKKKAFLPLGIALGALTVGFFVAYFVLLGTGNESYWKNFCPGLGLGCAVLLLFFSSSFGWKGAKCPK